MAERRQIIYPGEIKMVTMVGNLMVVIGLGKRFPVEWNEITIYW